MGASVKADSLCGGVWILMNEFTVSKTLVKRKIYMVTQASCAGEPEVDWLWLGPKVFG